MWDFVCFMVWSVKHAILLPYAFAAVLYSVWGILALTARILVSVFPPPLPFYGPITHAHHRHLKAGQNDPAAYWQKRASDGDESMHPLLLAWTQGVVFYLCVLLVLWVLRRYWRYVGPVLTKVVYRVVHDNVS